MTKNSSTIILIFINNVLKLFQRFVNARDNSFELKNSKSTLLNYLKNFLFHMYRYIRPITLHRV